MRVVAVDKLREHWSEFSPAVKLFHAEGWLISIQGPAEVYCREYGCPCDWEFSLIRETDYAVTSVADLLGLIVDHLDNQFG